MGYEHQMPFYCIADGDLPAFHLRMIGVRKGGRERIEEHRGRVLKGYGVLGNVSRSLTRVPLKSHARSLSHGIVRLRSASFFARAQAYWRHVESKSGREHQATEGSLDSSWTPRATMTIPK